jgi:hypothetical protein
MPSRVGITATRSSNFAAPCLLKSILLSWGLRPAVMSS